ncbi:MAG: sigma-70 family RNA polymerase sigma factor [Lentisphaeraceae bacterium]|nr:sigma-70 family RNA polymerase sigma factor [Lentisphaeraceae bacterium]
MQSREDILRQAFRYQDLLETYAYTWLNDWNLCKDAVQEAFIQVSEQWQEIDSERLLPWLKTVTKRRAIDIIRKRNRIVHREDLVNLVDGHFDNYLNEEMLDKVNHMRSRLQKCLSKLSPENLKVLLGFYDKKLSTEKLAEMINKSPNAVRILLHRIRHQLKKCISQELS